jgi:chlorite dismutase
MSGRLFTFMAGDIGAWRIARVDPVIGAALGSAPRLAVHVGPSSERSVWTLRGMTSNERYVVRSEKNQLLSKQPAIGRNEATCAALIPIRKSAAWWALPQDERRKIFEESSKHIAIGLRYLPAVARRLHHCRDLSDNEPFDFLTWFEYAPADSASFEALVNELRATEEWKYVEREVDVRLERQI